VHVELPAHPLPLLNADRVKLEQVLLNLLVNAMEAMPQGGLLSIRADEIFADEAQSIRIEVMDSGSGIPDDVRDRIFDPYFTTKNEGTGMGLALCDKIVREHRGTLDFRNSAEGTVFELTLPRE
jgi:two-component system nitrogen regulation sensor histidine kinase GlnL